MRDKLGISVIMPCYNAGAFVEKAVVSVEKHNTQNIPIQIVIIDDASTDEATHDALHRLRRQDNVRVLRLIENSGNPARPRNIGLVCAKHDYIFPLDADDMMNNDPAFLEEHGDFFSTALAKLESNQDLALISLGAKQFSHDPAARVSVYTPSIYSEAKMLCTSRLTVSSLMRKDDVIASGGYPTDVSCVEDWLFYLAFLNTRLKNNLGTSVEKVMSHHLLYRQHAHGNNVNNRARDWPSIYKKAVELAPDLYEKHFPMIAPDKRAAFAMELSGRAPVQAKPQDRRITTKLLHSLLPRFRVS